MASVAVENVRVLADRFERALNSCYLVCLEVDVRVTRGIDGQWRVDVVGAGW